MTKKMTKKDYFEILKGAYPKDANNYNEVIEFINHELELLAKKNSGERKLTTTQKENLTIKADILTSMESGKRYTITDMMKEFECCNGLSNQKVSRLVTQLKEDNLVERIEEKRKTYFVKVEA